MASPLCEMHGVVLAPDGGCVLCRRAAAESRARRQLRVVCLAALAMVAATLGVAAAGVRLREAARAASAISPSPSAAVIAAGPAPTDERRHPPPAAAPTAPPAPTETTTEPPTAARGSVDDYERKVEAASRNVEIDFYGAAWCPSCRAARAWLDSNGIAYTYKDTENDTYKHMMRALNPDSTIPTIDIGGRVIVGYRPAEMKSAIRAAAARKVTRAM